MRIVFMGSGEVGMPSLTRIADRPNAVLAGVVTQPDKPAGRGMTLVSPPPKVFAQSLGVAVLQPAKMRAAEAVDALRALQPDVIVVMAYGQILSRAVLDIPRLGCINLHASLLPRHRGAAPIHAAIDAGDAETGITAMLMDEGLDTGDMLLKRAIPIGPQETCGSLHDRLAVLAAEVIEETLDVLERGSLERVPQDAALATYAAKLSRSSGRLDWKLPGEVLERRARAMHPWPGVFTKVPTADGAKVLKVHIARYAAGRSGAPGEVLGMDRGVLLVAAGEGALGLVEVQLEGRKRMSAAEFLRGHEVRSGEVWSVDA